MRNLNRSAGAGMRRLIVASFLALVGLPASAIATDLAADVPLTHTPVPVEKMNTRFMDIMTIDQDTHMLYVGDTWTAGIDVYDVSSGAPQLVTVVPTRTGGSGVIVAKPVNKLYAGVNGLTVIDIDPQSPTYNKVLTAIDTGGGGGEMDYDPVHNLVVVAYRGAQNYVVLVDANTDTIVAKIENVGKDLEQPRFNPVDNMIYGMANATNSSCLITKTDFPGIVASILGVPRDLRITP